jgi:hypothetical protein
VRPPERRGPVPRPWLTAALTLGSAAITALATFLRWPSLGRSHVDGYRLVGSLGALAATLDLTSVRLVAAAWFVIPLSVGVGVLALAVDRTPGWWAAGACNALAAVAAALVLWAAHRVGLTSWGAGPAVAVVGATLGVVGALVGRRSRRVVADPTDLPT